MNSKFKTIREESIAWVHWVNVVAENYPKFDGDNLPKNLHTFISKATGRTKYLENMENLRSSD